MTADRACPTCKLPFAEPACASPEHKRVEREIAQGWLTPQGRGRGQHSSSRSSRRTVGILRSQSAREQEPIVNRVGATKCPTCQQWKPNRYYWDRKRRLLTKTCGKCRLAASTQSRVARRGSKLHATAQVDAFWEAQAQAHP